MPILFIGTGLILLLTGVKGDPAKLYAALENDFSGPGNFVYWTAAMVVLGALGYIRSLQSLSRLFMGLILIVLLLDNRGFFAQLQGFINSSSGGKQQ